MKKVVLLVLVLLSMAFAVRTKLISETTQAVAADTTYTVTNGGYVEIFAHEKCYVDLDGSAAANLGSRYISAGGSLDTEIFYFPGETIRLRADDGACTVNITTYLQNEY